MNISKYDKTCRPYSQQSDQRNVHCLLDIYVIISQTVPTCFDAQGIIIREPIKAVLHKAKLATFVHSRHDVKVS
jgi:hypothetical protein